MLSLQPILFVYCALYIKSGLWYRTLAVQTFNMRQWQCWQYVRRTEISRKRKCHCCIIVARVGYRALFSRREDNFCHQKCFQLLVHLMINLFNLSSNLSTSYTIYKYKQYIFISFFRSQCEAKWKFDVACSNKRRPATATVQRSCPRGPVTSTLVALTTRAVTSFPLTHAVVSNLAARGWTRWNRKRTAVSRKHVPEDWRAENYQPIHLQECIFLRQEV